MNLTCFAAGSRYTWSCGSLHQSCAFRHPFFPHVLSAHHQYKSVLFFTLSLLAPRAADQQFIFVSALHHGCPSLHFTTGVHTLCRYHDTLDWTNATTSTEELVFEPDDLDTPLAEHYGMFVAPLDPPGATFSSSFVGMLYVYHTPSGLGETSGAPGVIGQCPQKCALNDAFIVLLFVNREGWLFVSTRKTYQPHCACCGRNLQPLTRVRLSHRGENHLHCHSLRVHSSTLTHTRTRSLAHSITHS